MPAGSLTTRLTDTQAQAHPEHGPCQGTFILKVSPVMSLFITCPVESVDRATEFYTALGWWITTGSACCDRSRAGLHFLEARLMLDEVKAYRTYNQQAELLAHRGMDVGDRNRAAGVLRRVNCYRLRGTAPSPRSP